MGGSFYLRRKMMTPAGEMSVELTNCGTLGWVSDRRGCRYSAVDPATEKVCPPMPEVLRQFAQDAAERAGLPGFEPDACLINRYLPGSRLSLHQDRNERDFAHPIVAVSLGLDATFLLGEQSRQEPTRKVPLTHGDVVVWGGRDRLRCHGVLPVREGNHAGPGAQPINLTFRKAG